MGVMPSFETLHLGALLGDVDGTVAYDKIVVAWKTRAAYGSRALT